LFNDFLLRDAWFEEARFEEASFKANYTGANMPCSLE